MFCGMSERFTDEKRQGNGNCGMRARRGFHHDCFGNTKNEFLINVPEERNALRCAGKLECGWRKHANENVLLVLALSVTATVLRAHANVRCANINRNAAV